MTVDLNTCVPGQLVELRNGDIIEYSYCSIEKGRYPHRIGDSFYTDGGHYYTCREEDDNDVVKIFSLTKPEQPKTDKHPSIAWWESCPWITDRKPTEADGDCYGQVIMQCVGREGTKTTLIMYWKCVELGQTWIHCMNFNLPTQTPKEQAIELINNHEDGWKPTTEQWLIIRKGLEAS